MVSDVNLLRLYTAAEPAHGDRVRRGVAGGPWGQGHRRGAAGAPGVAGGGGRATTRRTQPRLSLCSITLVEWVEDVLSLVVEWVEDVLVKLSVCATTTVTVRLCVTCV